MFVSEDECFSSSEQHRTCGRVEQGEEEEGEEGRHCEREREWVSEVKVLGCAEEIEKLDFEERTALTLVTAELN